jgi:hypothetical protein
MQMGLEPRGDGGSWFQPFELLAGLTVGAENHLTLRYRDTAVGRLDVDLDVPPLLLMDRVTLSTARVAWPRVIAPQMWNGWSPVVPWMTAHRPSGMITCDAIDTARDGEYADRIGVGTPSRRAGFGMVLAKT